MKYAGINFNDFAAADGVCLTVYTQGCPHHCFNCHNPETWDFDGGKEFTSDTLNSIIKGLTANGITRTLCIMGGEPLCDENIFLTLLIITEVKKQLPNVKICIWTGYLYEYVRDRKNNNLQLILANTDIIVDGPYLDSLRDTSLKMRGSSNQRIIELKH